MKKIILMFLISFNVYAENCGEYDTKIIFNGKGVLSKETLCTMRLPENMAFFTSKSCDKRACEILKRKKNTISFKQTTIGSPGFKICEELGGVPQIFEYKKGTEEWQSNGRCFFGSRDFVEISLLSIEWKSFINR